MELVGWLLSAWTLMGLSETARILAVLPYNARSHYVVMEPLLLALRSRGHHLTVVSSFPQQRPLQNYRDIDLSSKLPSLISNMTLDDIRQKMPHVLKTAPFIAELHTAVCQKLLGDEQVLAVLNDTYDLFIGEIFGSDCFNYFAHKLRVPLVSWVTSSALPWVADRTGLPDNPSYVPNYFVDYGPAMNFYQRCVNTLTLVYAKTAYYLTSELTAQRLAEEAFHEKLPSLDQINKRTSLVLMNSHYSLFQSRPFPPNVIEVGGIHIQNTQPLPKDLKDILDNAKDGAILVSFGSLVRVASLPKSMIATFLQVFASLPQTVFFKYEEDLPDYQMPPNVVVRKWLPQTDIISHASVRAVVTHGGLASTIEAVHFAKPLVGIPLFSDQYQNVKSVVRRGAGVLVDIDGISYDSLLDALKTVLEDPRYADNMMRLSLQFRDRPQSALDSAVYWTEYVLRHQGAHHLRPASVSIPLYQYLLCDVIVLLLLPLAAAAYTVLFILRRTFTACCRGVKSENILKKQKLKKIKTK